MDILTNSKRLFTIYYVDSMANNFHLENVSLHEVLTRDEEVFYTLQERLDDVLDIPEKCTLEFKLRDDSRSYGLITRTK